MSASEQNLTAKQQKAVAALLESATHDEAAVRANVAPRTLRRWLQDSTFQAEYRAARARCFESVMVRLQRIADKAADALEKNLTCGSPNVEVRSALGILATAVKCEELLTVNERLDDLERRLTEQRQKPQPYRA